MFLSKGDFKNAVSIVPIIAIDICIINNKKILLGYRKNPPAINHYFVPGGRIRKGETIEAAFKRILFDELGGILKSEFDILKNLIGIYQHFYEDNFLGNKEFDSHYVVLAFKLAFNEIEISKISNFNNQHSEQIWHDYLSESRKKINIHKYTQEYLSNDLLI